MTTLTLETKRLYLRQWQPSDFAIFADMNADAEVMRYFPNLLSASVSDIIASKCQQLINDNGWGLWAVSIKDGLKKSDAFIDFGRVLSGEALTNPSLVATRIIKYSVASIRARVDTRS